MDGLFQVLAKEPALGLYMTTSSPVSMISYRSSSTVGNQPETGVSTTEAQVTEDKWHVALLASQVNGFVSSFSLFSRKTRWQPVRPTIGSMGWGDRSMGPSISALLEAILCE
jgi:hypothetical protein